MAIYKIFPEKSATIYSFYPTLNTGLDEILELSTYYSINGTDEVSRTLIQFPSAQISDIIANKVLILIKNINTIIENFDNHSSFIDIDENKNSLIQLYQGLIKFNNHINDLSEFIDNKTFIVLKIRLFKIINKEQHTKIITIINTIEDSTELNTQLTESCKIKL